VLAVLICSYPTSHHVIIVCLIVSRSVLKVQPFCTAFQLLDILYWSLSTTIFLEIINIVPVILFCSGVYSLLGSFLARALPLEEGLLGLTRRL